MRGTLDPIIDTDDQSLLRPCNHDTDHLRAILHLREGCRVRPGSSALRHAMPRTGRGPRRPGDRRRAGRKADYRRRRQDANPTFRGYRTPVRRPISWPAASRRSLPPSRAKVSGGSSGARWLRTYDTWRYRSAIRTRAVYLESGRSSTEPSRSARSSSGPIGRSKNARLSTGYGAPPSPAKGEGVPTGAGSSCPAKKFS